MSTVKNHEQRVRALAQTRPGTLNKRWVVLIGKGGLVAIARFATAAIDAGWRLGRDEGKWEKRPMLEACGHCGGQIVTHWREEGRCARCGRDPQISADDALMLTCTPPLECHQQMSLDV